MEYGAIDLHARKTLIRIVDADGAVILDRTITTTREGLTQVFGGRARMRVLLETGTESEWVAQAIEAAGHEAVVADPNYALMYGVTVRAVKTDRRDVAALAEACRLGIYHVAHRVSAAQRQVRRQLRVREQLIRMRTQAINLVRAQLRQEGYRLPPGASPSAAARCRRVPLQAAVRDALAPMLTLLDALGPLIKACDQTAATQAAADPVVRRLMTVPGVGPVVGLTYRAVLDDVGRFRDASSSTAFLGLVPREDSSGVHRRKGHITKRGPTTLRVLLIQAAWAMWRQRHGRAALHAWVERLAARRGRRIAIVALARRLARVLFAMLRDGCDYRPVPVAA